MSGKGEHKCNRFRWGLIIGILLSYISWIIALIIGAHNGAIK